MISQSTVQCHLRPTALLRMYAKDVIDVESRIPVSHHVLFVSPFEKEVATKSGAAEEASHMPKTKEPHFNHNVSLRGFWAGLRSM